MILKDKNETLQPPEGGAVHSVSAEGSYLRVRYALPDSFTDIYLNDQGREVLRLTWRLPEKPPESPKGDNDSAQSLFGDRNVQQSARDWECIQTELL